MARPDARARAAPRFQPRRELGSTGFRATVLGIGDVADRSVPLETCVATVRRAMDAGLNVIDTAPGYEDGFSEEIVGRAHRRPPRPGGASGRRALPHYFVFARVLGGSMGASAACSSDWPERGGVNVVKSTPNCS